MEASKLEIDVGHLKVVDARPVVDLGEIDARATAAMQSLVDVLFQLPMDSAATEEMGSGRVVRLLTPRERLPREKPLPKREAMQSKWERFAQAKGIRGKKRERFVWDDAHQEWRPRHGGGKARPSIKSNATEWVVEDTDHVPKGQNPFRRTKRGTGARPGSKKDAATTSLASGKSPKPDRVREAQRKLSERTRRVKDELDRKLGIVQRSTASLGTHDHSLPGERDQRHRIKRRSAEPNTPHDHGTERKRVMRVAESVLQRMR
ncbi:Rhodanese- sulfurtransferase [Cyanidiococcus yangmingshanensis]|uniref:Ribosome biogenesis regulatory protein n=1 Tax=Cyanidiococcus yangmingshanensis TaxID=2690220 RepID=A0A7J7IL15_9RHOD|nr:Rhodanese- sulfurtransferase [Cyanidiococcus yangmingshanensis]